MLRAIALEIRDRATFIPVVAVVMRSGDEGAAYLLRRCGYGLYSDQPPILLARMNGDGQAHSDPYDWIGSRTMQTAHLWIIEHSHELADGDVVDVEFILGETPAPKQSERELPL